MMNIKWFVLLFLLVTAFSINAIVACGDDDDDDNDDLTDDDDSVADDDDSGDGDSVADDDDDDLTDDDDDTTDDDTGDDDVDDDDDTGDDDVDDDDDTGDDDTAGGAQYPGDHDTSWDCYLCHNGGFANSPAEPHNDAYTAPAQCLECHAAGSGTSTPSGIGGHSPTKNCLNCHQGKHGKTWQNKSQCLLCHPAK